jgi:hypothetical protein
MRMKPGSLTQPERLTNQEDFRVQKRDATAFPYRMICWGHNERRRGKPRSCIQ